jgi:hypothetical protein
MTSILVGNTRGATVRYVVGEPALVPTTAEAEVVVRDWDVSDPEARYEAAVKELGPITEANRYDAQWFINEKRNAAALAVYRPESFAR